jgi:hypothetical protein
MVGCFLLLRIKKNGKKVKNRRKNHHHRRNEAVTEKTIE